MVDHEILKQRLLEHAVSCFLIYLINRAQSLKYDALSVAAGGKTFWGAHWGYEYYL